MRLERFLNVIGGEMVRVERGKDFLYEGDKNAIRMHAPELIYKHIDNIEPYSKNKFIVKLVLEEY